MDKYVFLVFIGMVGCGVRGDPVPPTQPPTLGRGQPMYKEATKDLATPYVPPLYDSEEEKKKDEQKNRKD